jgi:hypothetical protein
MSIFETLGHAQILRDEANKQLASALADGFRMLTHYLARLARRTLRPVPDEHPYP